jgi:hypothetical protein
MTDSTPDTETGTIVALLERMRTQRLPRTLDIKEKVDAGGKLDDYDLAFLQEVAGESAYVKGLWDRHPEFHEIGGRIIHLYHEITEKALANEQAANEQAANPGAPAD